MLLLWCTIAVGLGTLCSAAIYSCHTKTDTFQPKCRCDERDTYTNLTCPINEYHTVDVLLNPLEYSFEIDCKNQLVKNTSYIPALVYDATLEQAEYYGFIECDMKEFVNLTTKLITTKNVTRVQLKKIKRLIPSALKGYRIKVLHVVESPINEIPEDLLYDIDGLEDVFININNNLTTIPEGFFKKSKNLRRIDLGQNNIKEIPVNLFRELQDLTTLLLFGNKLTTIHPTTFMGLDKLTLVELMTNQLSNLEEDTFIHLPQLTDLSLRNNQLKTLPAGLFKNNKKLQTLRLGSNQFLTSLPEKFFEDLTALTTVIIDYTSLNTIPENVFWGTSKLTRLHLNDNKLKHLKRDLFRDTINLKELNLKNNDLEILEGGIFNRVKNLVELDLSQNKLIITDDTFSGLKNLEYLYLQHNSLSSLTKNSLKHFKNLTVLDMSYNNLTMESYFTFQPNSILPLLPKLEILNLQHNSISYIFNDWVIATPNLKELNLAYNNISYLDYTALQFLQDHTVTINLEHNKIITIDLGSAESIIKANQPNLEASRIVLLNGNPIICDCRIFDLIRYIDGTMLEDVRKILHLDLNGIKCHSATKYIGTPLIDLKSKSLTCVLENGPKLPPSCKQDVSSQYYQLRRHDKRIIMNCSFKGLTEMPRIEFPTTFEYKNSCIEVSLRGNNITSLSKPADGYDNVVVLDLSHNNINEITWIPPKIEVLKLHDNNITYLNNYELSLINKTSVKNLTFHDNPWQCDCNLINFTKYLQENFKKVGILHDIRCNEKDRRELTRLSPEDLCTNIHQIITVVCGLLAFFAIVMSIGVALFYQYRQQIKVWMYARNLCLYFITEDELDQDKLYDAFVSFSHEDEDFVVGELLPGLEEEPHPFRLCVHFRDWQPGEFIATNIARSIDESRRTVVVLSAGFLRSEWGRMEFRTAHTEALKEGRARVVVIVYGDIGPVDELDAELRAYLTTNTYIKWGTPWFWDNLRYALPHSSKHNRSLQNPSRAISKQPEKISKIDQVDLIKEPCTPPAASTPPADAVRQMHDPLLHSALNVALVDGALVNTRPDKPHVNNNHLTHIV